jgi:hypothetical protein
MSSLGVLTLFALLEKHSALCGLVDTTPDKLRAFYPCTSLDENGNANLIRGLSGGLSVIDLLSRTGALSGGLSVRDPLRCTASENYNDRQCDTRYVRFHWRRYPGSADSRRQ